MGMAEWAPKRRAPGGGAAPPPPPRVRRGGGGAAAERGAGELFHRREERIHVDVENPTLIHIP